MRSVGRQEKKEIHVRLNGKNVSEEAEPRMLLIHFLKERLKVAGTHIGCDTGHCGACTVLFNGRTVKSCMMLAQQAEGGDILTVEGLADGEELHPIQRAFKENHGLQCGYCTPGFLISSYYLLKNNPEPTDEEIKRAIDGNICRCTGYFNIIKSVRAAAKTMRQEE